MKEDCYQITIPYKEYKRLKDKEIQLQNLEKDIRGCFELNYLRINKPIPIHVNNLIEIGKRTLPFYCKNVNYVEV